MKYISILGSILGRAFIPIKVNFAFFVFMFLLGYACNMLEVPRGKGNVPYELTSIELFFDLYIICLILSFIPVKIRRWVRATMYVIIYTVSIIDVYCFVKFRSTLTPSILLLIGETNSSEASEFLSSYIDWSIITSQLGWILLIMLAHIIVNIVARQMKVHPAIRHKLIGRTGRMYKKLSVKDKTKVSIGAAAGGILGVISIIMLIDSYMQTIENKKATVRLMSYENIGEVERELNKKDRATLYLPIYRLAFSIYANELTAKQLDKLIAGIERVNVDSCSYLSKNIVLVIGESYNKHHSQLYGYNHPTTPYQLQLEKEGGLTVFTDVVAPWNLTSFAFKNLFSMHSVGDEGEWCDYPLFPELFRKAGYKVTFITNQFLPQAKEAIYDFSGGFFLNNPKLSKAQFDVRNQMLYKYDAGVLMDYDRITKSESEKDSTDRPSLTILHLKGQHVNYRDRYPKKRKKFKAENYKEWNKLDRKSKMILANYDNATLYNDSIMNQIIKRFEDKDAIIIYLSDHGEEAFGKGIKYYGRKHTMAIDYDIAHEEYEVPFWIWCSKKYIKKHPDIFRKIKAVKDKPLMTDNLAQVLIYLAGIHTPYYISKYNILSDDFDTTRKRMLKDVVDYNELKAGE